MNHSVLRNESNGRILLEQGFLVLDLLPNEVVGELLEFFQQSHPGSIPPFYATAHSESEEVRVGSSRFIHQKLKPYLDPLVKDCTLLGGSFIVKTNESNSRLEAHQDWNLVDESIFRSYNLWVPLVQTKEQTGALKVLPGSHSWPMRWRGPNASEPLNEVIQEVWEEMIAIDLLPGQAILYDHALYHGSFPNLSPERRVALVLGVVPQGAELLHSVQEGNQVTLYKSSVDFYLSGNIQTGHENLEIKSKIPLGEVDYMDLWSKRKTKASGSWSNLITRWWNRFFSNSIEGEWGR